MTYRGRLQSAMSHISKPVDWEVFNIPPVQPVQYYSILKKKREFSQFIKQYDAQVFKRGYLHYCGIVPKNLSPSFNNRYEIVIVFFDEIPNNSFIGFRVKASKETFTYESNSLLLFLKKSKKAIFYLMNNNCIHVQCGTNAWELFYLLYDDYLRKYVLTIIGTQFFYHFVYSHCIKREIQLIDLLYKGSKIIRISKNSIYYKIHRKRKISVTDLIHMTVNMPKSKRFIISYFNSKENFEDGDFYTSVGNKINVSKLKLKKVKKEFESPLTYNSANNSITFEDMLDVSGTVVSQFKACRSDKFFSNNMKRKFKEFEDKHSLESGPSTSKFFKSAESSSVGKIYEDQWEQYQNLKPFAVKCYSGIASISNIVPNLFKNGKSIDFVNSNFYSKSTDNVSMPSLTKLNETTKNSIPAIVEISGKIDHISSFSSTKMAYVNATEVINESLPSVKLKKPFENETHIDSDAPKNLFSNLQNLNKSHEQCSHLDITDKVPTTSLKTPKIINQDCFSFGNDGDFTTAAGKTIIISDTAILAANKLMQGMLNDGNQEGAYEKVCDLNKACKISSFKSNYPDCRKKAGTKVPFAKISVNKPTFGVKIKDNENFRQNSFDTMEDASFTTAAGKTIHVSSNAMQAAHKLIHTVFKEENKPTSSEGINIDKDKTCANAIASVDFGGSSEVPLNETVDIDVNMDKTLVEKLFEEKFFDEKELESTTECNTNENSNLSVKSKTDKNLPSRKPRKSLGGRRSMRYCSTKL